jgi:hypothetical protein
MQWVIVNKTRISVKIFNLISIVDFNVRLTALSQVLLENLPVALLLNNFPTLYGTRRFITVFTRAQHWSLS